MKKTLPFLFAFLGTGLMASAQVTIISTDVVGTGLVIKEATDTVTAFNIGASGANQVWGFGALLEHTVDTSTFMSPSSAPGSFFFPNATIAMNSTDDDSSYVFIEKTTSLIRVIGFTELEPGGSTTSQNVIFDILSFPSSMGTTFTTTNDMKVFADTINVDPDGPGPHAFVDSIKMTRTATISSEIDAWGTMTTPLGSYAVLRQDINEVNIDTMWMYSGGAWSVISPTLAAFGMDSVSTETINMMRWWTNDPTIGFPLVEMEYDVATGNNTGEVEWLKETPSVGISNSAVSSELNIFPNPSNGTFVLTYHSNNYDGAEINVYDSFGKLVFADMVTGKITEIGLEELKSGLYFLQVKLDNTTITRKLVKE